MNNFVITHLDSFYSDELNTVHHSSELNTVQLVSSELNRAQLDLTQLSLKKHQDLPIRIRRRHKKKLHFVPIADGHYVIHFQIVTVPCFAKHYVISKMKHCKSQRTVFLSEFNF